MSYKEMWDSRKNHTAGLTMSPDSILRQTVGFDQYRHKCHFRAWRTEDNPIRCFDSPVIQLPRIDNPNSCVRHYYRCNGRGYFAMPSFLAMLRPRRYPKLCNE